MASVTRFPHYHQAENVVTNHVMVMLRILYDASPKLLEGLLEAMCENEVAVGPRFSQQVAGIHSVPDGLILQEPLAVFVETKVGSAINPDQLQRHCRTIAERVPEGKSAFLISLTSGRFGQEIPGEVTAMAQKYGIKVVSATFGKLVAEVTEIAKLGNDLVLRERWPAWSDRISGILSGSLPFRCPLPMSVFTQGGRRPTEVKTDIGGENFRRPWPPL